MKLLQEKNLPDDKLEDILSLYEKTLTIPKTKPKNQFLLCAVGLVGSGKTTAMKPLSKELGLVRMAGDEIRKVLYDNGYNQKRLMDLSILFNHKYLKLGYSMALDSDCSKEGVRNDIYKFGDQYGAKAIFIHINPPEKFVINKLSNIKEPWPWLLKYSSSKTLLEEYYLRKKLHTNLNIPFLCEIDTSAPDLKSQLKNAIDLIREETQVNQ